MANHLEEVIRRFKQRNLEVPNDLLRMLRKQQKEQREVRHKAQRLLGSTLSEDYVAPWKKGQMVGGTEGSAPDRRETPVARQKPIDTDDEKGSLSPGVRARSRESRLPTRAGKRTFIRTIAPPDNRPHCHRCKKGIEIIQSYWGEVIDAYIRKDLILDQIPTSEGIVDVIQTIMFPKKVKGRFCQGCFDYLYALKWRDGQGTLHRGITLLADPLLPALPAHADHSNLGFSNSGQGTLDYEGNLNKCDGSWMSSRGKRF